MIREQALERDKKKLRLPRKHGKKGRKKKK
jgi:hypothetical protein